jgi:valyl-tRNA synthetase
MHIFPKQYTQTKTIPCAQHSSASSFFFLPEQYSQWLHVDQLFRLFILDALHCIAHGDHLAEWYFLPLCTDSEFSQRISFAQKQLKKFWLLSLMDNVHTPLDFTFRYDLQDFFVHYFSQGIFFEDRFIVYWSNLLKSPVSWDFLEFIEGKKNRYTLKYFVSTKNNSLNVITDSPETIFWDVALAIHPQHKKAKVLKWQAAIIPIINKTIPIIIDERADFTRYGGVYRVSPGHDKIGLEIAKDHNLPIDTYAVDEHWLFTEHAGLFAGKPVEEFFSNIIQNLSDIGNLIATEEVDATIATCKQTWEILTPHCWKWLFVKLPEEHLLRFLEQEQIASLALSKDYITNSYWLASSCQRTGIDVPLRKTEKW